MKVTVVSWYGGHAICVYASASVALDRAKEWCLIANDPAGDPNRVVSEMVSDGSIRVGWQPDNPNVAVQWKYILAPYTVREA